MGTPGRFAHRITSDTLVWKLLTRLLSQLSTNYTTEENIVIENVRPHLINNTWELFEYETADVLLFALSQYPAMSGGLCQYIPIFCLTVRNRAIVRYDLFWQQGQMRIVIFIIIIIVLE